MVQEINWRVFKAKFNGREQSQFEWLCYFFSSDRHFLLASSLQSQVRAPFLIVSLFVLVHSASGASAMVMNGYSADLFAGSNS